MKKTIKTTSCSDYAVLARNVLLSLMFRRSTTISAARHNTAPTFWAGLSLPQPDFLI